MKKNRFFLFLFKPLENKKALYAVIILQLVYCILKLFIGSYHLVDSYEYLETAQNILQGTLYQSDYFTATRRPWLYPVFLIPFVSSKTWVIVVIQSLFSCLSIYLFFKILQRLGGQLNLFFLLLIIGTPSLFIYPTLIMSEWLVSLLLLTLFYLLTLKFSHKIFLGIQIVLILLTFTKPIFYPIVYISMVFWIIHFIKNRIFSIYVILPILIIQLYQGFNEYKTDYFHFSSIQNKNLIDFNLFYFKSNHSSYDEAVLWRDNIYNKDYNNKTFKEKNKFLEHTAYVEIKNNFISYSWYHFYTAIRGVFDPGRYDIISFIGGDKNEKGLLKILNSNDPLKSLLSHKNSTIYILLLPIFLLNLLKIGISIYGLIKNKWEFKYYLIPLIIISYILISGPVNTSRYMMPLQLCILIIVSISFRTQKS